MKNIISNKYISFGLILAGGIFLGWFFFHTPSGAVATHKHEAEGQKKEIWTCSMHPQIQMTEPGKCPICGMDLIPLRQGGTTYDADAIHMTREAAQLANVLTTVVSKQNPVKDIRLYGKVQADERLLQNLVSYLPGRIEKLYVNFTGETVRKGQMLASIYSPDLVTAQQELLETAATKKSQPMLYEAAKEKLLQWKLTESQVSGIESSGKIKTNFEIYANASGIVTAQRVNTGDFIAPGSVLFEVTDLSRVWIMFDAYESDLPYLSTGQKVSFTIQSMPGQNFSGTIAFIDPIIDPVTRVAKTRVEIGNQGMKLKPEMFATGIVNATLNQFSNKLVIPRSAVLWTGKRSIVYVKQPGSNEPVFKMREIELGPMLSNSYVVESGLMDGEEIVSQGAFSVDASAQLEGKPSMMNPKVSDMSHQNSDSKNKVSDQNSAAKATGTKSQESLQKATFNVSGNCGMCKDRIETAAKSVKGVSSASWSSKTKKIDVEFNSALTSVNAIQKAIARVGHDTGKYKADDKVYSALPACCLYRK